MCAETLDRIDQITNCPLFWRQLLKIATTGNVCSVLAGMPVVERLLRLVLLGCGHLCGFAIRCRSNRAAYPVKQPLRVVQITTRLMQAGQLQFFLFAHIPFLEWGENATRLLYSFET